MYDLDAAHKHSSHHRGELQDSDKCGCFYCRSVFRPADITTWIEGGQTATCPTCGIDSVIGDKSGFPIVDDFLSDMCERWFSLPKKKDS